MKMVRKLWTQDREAVGKRHTVVRPLGDLPATVYVANTGGSEHDWQLIPKF